MAVQPHTTTGGLWVATRELQPVLRSKRDLYEILSKEGQLYLPPFDDCPIEFLRDLLSGAKKALFNKEVRLVVVPKLECFTLKSLQKQAAVDADLSPYLPPMREHRPCNRGYLFNVINTVKP
mmetsp:Transcript_17920/g.12904  ORF Transcript_17920/g.12904 Transcript_17920/m.12904 type:complete len:122 (-) Transcript_17920:368-733(-)